MSLRALRRPLWLVGILGAMIGLAFLVARPRADHDPAAVAYAERGVARSRAPGLQIFYSRGAEVGVLAPGVPLRGGDALRFVVRCDQPRYLILRGQGGGDRERLLFPADGRAALVHSGETLPATLVLAGAPGDAAVTALFGLHPFGNDDPIGGEVEAVRIALRKE